MTPLRKRMIKDMTVRCLAANTRKSYLNSVSGLARHYGRSSDDGIPAVVNFRCVQVHVSGGSGVAFFPDLRC